MTPVPSGQSIRRWRYLIQVVLRLLAFGLVLYAVHVAYGEVTSYGLLPDLINYLTAAPIRLLVLLGTPLLIAALILFCEKRIIAFLAPLPARGCPNCGYSLANLRSPICPECGTDLGTPSPDQAV